MTEPTVADSTWRARWIAGGSAVRTEAEPAVVFRRAFRLRGPVRRARLAVTARGAFEAFINGAKVGDDLLAPGWTSYTRRTLWRTHDVTDLLRDGDNSLGAVVTDGWYAGRLGFGGGERNLYGTELGVLAQLEVDYNDGTAQVMVSDAQWQWAEGEIVSSSLYDGAVVDLRRARDWDAAWPDAQPVRDRGPADPTLLEEQKAPAVRVTGIRHPEQVTTLGDGRLLIDFGQNMSGRLRLRLPAGSAPAGHVIDLRHAEVLEGGELSLRPLRAAAQHDRLILAGGEVDWAPVGTVHGFRYAELSGWPRDVPVSDGGVTAEVVHTDMQRTGWFTCSHPLVNRLHENIVWSFRGNAVSIPTDCPQRDERLGWTGDAQLFAPTATFLYDAADFFSSWLRDLALEQEDDGRVPLWIPTTPVNGFPPFFAAVWGDAAVIVPWTVYQAYGDLDVLRAQHASMRAWMEATTSRIGEDGLWRQPFQFGDWLDPAAPPENPSVSETDADLVSNAYLIRCCRIMAATADALGDPEDGRRWSAIAASVQAAWISAFTREDGRLVGDTAATYALAIAFDLLDDDARERAGEHLAEKVRAAGHVITTGFVGTPVIADALTATGHHEDAGRLLLQTECPSWLYPVTMGATTVWERWDSLLPDGSVNPGEMTSFNHYALGAIGDWLHRVVGGLAYTAAPTAALVVDPRPVAGIDHATTRRMTPHGLVSVTWRREDDRLTVETEVPEALPATDGAGRRIPSGRTVRTYDLAEHR